MNMDKARKAILAKVKGVNDLVALGLMREMSKESSTVYIEPILLSYKNKGYVKAWCQNVLRVWLLTYTPKDGGAKYRILTVRDMDDNVICEYSDDKGLIMKS